MLGRLEKCTEECTNERLCWNCVEETLTACCTAGVYSGNKGFGQIKDQGQKNDRKGFSYPLFLRLMFCVEGYARDQNLDAPFTSTVDRKVTLC